MVKIKLFCIPFAGGSANSYNLFRKYRDELIEICPIELAGRGYRFEELLYNNFTEMVDDVFNQIYKNIDDTPYALFGHSMGSLLAYEIGIRIKELDMTPPIHIFFSGNKPPSIKRIEKSYKSMSDEEFLNDISKYGGLPQDVLECKQLLDLFLPVLRADFVAMETHEFNNKGYKLDTDITVLNGKDDNTSLLELLEWRKHTNKNCKIYSFSGGHFFIFEDVENVSKVINGVLGRYITNRYQ